MRHSVAVRVAALTLVVSAPFAEVRAQDDEASDSGAIAEDPKPGDVSAAWTALQTARAELRAAMQGGDKAKVRELHTKEKAAQREFTVSFAAADWGAIDPSKEPEMLGQGLLLAGADGLARGDSKFALRAYESYLAKLPSGEAAALVEGAYLPAACVAAGDVARAVPLLEKHAQNLTTHVRAAALVLLGDVRAATESAQAARTAWAEVDALSPPNAGRDVYTRARAAAALRLALVGTPAPEIDTKTWCGAPARALSALKGSVVLLDFCATWCAPWRRVVRRGDALHAAKRKEGLVLLGVTRYFDYGFLPASSAEDLVAQGELVGEMSEEDFQAHLQQFRAATGISYPLATVTAADFKAYRIQDLPTSVLVDRQGNVAFVQVGAGSDTLLRKAVDRLLAAAAPSAK